MRRFLSIFVLLLVGSSAVGPFAMAAAVDDTPACCRRDGKHHCQSGMADMAGMAGASADTAPGLRAVAPSCPHRSLSATPAPAGQAEASQYSVPRLPGASFVSLPNSLGFGSLPVLLNSERGPPALSQP